MAEPIVVERRVAAPPARVYRFLTESNGWAAWQGVAATIESSSGGLFRMEMPNGMTARGEFVELVENELVVFTWGWIDYPGLPPGASTVRIELTADGNATLIRLTHTGLSAGEISIHTAGWNHYLPRLASAAEGRHPGPDPGPPPPETP